MSVFAFFPLTISLGSLDTKAAVNRLYDFHLIAKSLFLAISSNYLKAPPVMLSNISKR